VSNVFNRPEPVREEIRGLVHEAAHPLVLCRPEPRRGRLLRAGTVNAIGFDADQPPCHLFRDPGARRLPTVGADGRDAPVPAWFLLP
jgi:DNA-binding LacI/PurR family transcriptional regulator